MSQKKETEATEEQIRNAGIRIAQILIEIEMEDEDWKDKRKDHKDRLDALRERLLEQRDILATGRVSIDAQATLGEAAGKGRRVEFEEDDEKRERIKEVDGLAELITARLAELPDAARAFVIDIRGRLSRILTLFEDNDVDATPAHLNSLNILADEVDEWEEPDNA